MHGLSFMWITFAGILATTLAAPTHSPNYELRTVYQFPNFTWIENFDFRSNGQIVATDASNSRIYLVDPQKPQSTPAVIAQFPNRTILTGIAELEPDVFYVQGLLDSSIYTFQFAPNSSVVWQVDLRNYASTGHATVKKVASILPAVVLNGMSALSAKDGTLLLADSTGGVIYRLNVNTGDYSVAIDDAILKPVPGSETLFGANGIRVMGSTLYFSNLDQSLVGTFTIKPDGSVTGPAKIISNQTPNADDFAVGKDGSIWLTENNSNTLVRVSPNGSVQKIAGGDNSTALLGPVAAKFGRGKFDKQTLYISTDGLNIDSATGAVLASAGKIAAINTNTWC